MLRRIVVAGNGIAGLTAADALRAGGFDGELTIVGAEPMPAYSRPALSKALLREAGDLTAHQLPDADHGATEILGRSTAALDAKRRVIVLDDGNELPYDGLVVATGSRARRLGGTEHVLRTLDDARVLRERLASQPDVVVVGGGPLGMEIASGALEAGCRVTMVTNARPLRRHLGSRLSSVLTDAALAQGLNIVEAGNARTTGDRVELPDGSLLEAGLVVAAVGDLPNTEWMGVSGALDVDAQGRYRPGIVAAGDVAAFVGVRSPLWHSAIDQARRAAAALLGVDVAEPAPAPYFWTEQFGLTVRVVGRLPVDGEPELIDGEGLMRWGHSDGTGTAVAVNYRIPIPRLRRLCEPSAA